MAKEGIFVHQFELGPWDNFIYFIGDSETRECAVVDPAWHAPTILDEAARLDVKITQILCTHSHFDHVNRVDEILEATDAPVHMLKEEIAFSGFQCENLKPADKGHTLRIGKNLEIVFLHTPGHTPGSTCYRIRDGVVAGDTLFVNGCGRCDFVGGDPERMYRTLHTLMDKLPGNTVLYPGHNYGQTVTSTLDVELVSNPFLKLPTVADFVAHRMQDKARDTQLPPAPDDWAPDGV